MGLKACDRSGLIENMQASDSSVVASRGIKLGQLGIQEELLLRPDHDVSCLWTDRLGSSMASATFCCRQLPAGVLYTAGIRLMHVGRLQIINQ
jgi:hypothetical protein